MDNLAQGKFLNLKLYLEGIQVPVISAQINQRAGGMATANITIIPTAQALSILPRTNVLLFYYEPRAEKWDNKKKAYVPENENMRYCVIFYGEVVGHSYNKADQSRSLTLSCVDHTTYWDVAYAYHFNTADTKLEQLIQQKAHFLQANVSNPANSSISSLALSELLSQKPLSPEFQNIEGLLGGIIRVIEEMTGVVGSTGVNDFFSYANLRCKLIGQLAAPFNDTNSSKLFERSQLMDWLNGNILSRESTISLRSIIDYVLQYIFYQHSPNMSPHYIPPQSYVRTTVSEVNDPGLTAIVDDLRSKGFQLQDYIKVNNAAACEEVLTELLSSPQASLVALPAQTTTVPTITGVLAGLFGFTSNIVDNARIQINAKLLKTTIEAMQVAIMTNPIAWDLMASYIEAYLAALAQLVDLKGTKEIINQGDRLLTTIFHPNIFFAAPPRCNVIFPEYYNNLSYGRAFLNEATRLQLTSGLSENVGLNGEVEDKNYYAPNTANTLDSIQGKFSATDPELIRKLQPHELHTGIIPRFASFSERLSLWTEQAREEANIAGGDDLYFQRVANYFFFDDRLGSRSMSISGKFNPDMVVGFPCLVLDNPIFRPGITTLKDVEEHKQDLQQFLGVITEITHYISQDTGASSQATISYVRTHRAEDDELLRSTQKANPRIDLSQATKTTLNYSLLIAFGDVEKLRILLGVSSAAGAGSVTPSSAMGKNINVPTTPGSVKIGTTGPIGGTIVLIDVTDSEPPVGQDILATPGIFTTENEKIEALLQDPTIVPKDVYSSVDIYEFPKTQNMALVSLPVEEILRPSWISTIYQNSDIGSSVYGPLFGTGAITDNKGLVDVPKITFAGKTMVSLETAVDYLTVKYSESRVEKKNNSFAESYTYRPIATFRNIFGDKDTPGFATNLLDPGKTLIPEPGSVNITPGAACIIKKGIPPELDSRSEKQKRVLDYVKSISSRGLRN